MFDYKEYLYAQNGFKEMKECDRNSCIEKINKKIMNGDIHFDNVMFMKKNGRSTSFYEDYTVEKTLSNYLTNTINTIYSIRYPNRNLIIKNLIDSMKALKNLDDYTIYRFDFKKYFSSIHTGYAIEYIKLENGLNATQLQWFMLFSDVFDYLPVGNSISNAVSELLGSKFDEKLITIFGKENIIFYSRFIDDGIIILKNHFPKSLINQNVQRAIDLVYYRDDLKYSDLNRVKLNKKPGKESLVHRRNLVPTNISFLGYQFNIEILADNSTTNIKYGITESKQKKIKRKYLEIYAAQSKYGNNLKTLTYNLSRRVVYNRGSNNSSLWINKGITFNYGNLPYYISNGKLKSELIIPETDLFLKNFFWEINKELDLKMESYLCSQKYDLRYSMASNSAIIYHQTIGMSYSDLKSRAECFGIKTLNRSYDEILTEYLINLKLGY
ncbi:hypothetical protein [Erysipelothrix rhusiopathiae]|uniref:hypothetical protein n=1 Tax=Erysipelothrix phage SE-1 TaxID=1675317 RepID=UPI00065F554E|nr:hypothetical protein [Erysipelothrix rhusiopathiae]YP_009224247.1 hypothetical protein AXI73_gp22 [Erysipelothrix phage SE-1]AKQ06881.1 hypothetical protein [Erysipelothrix phage SE-1]MDV7685112.1 hypothetical protein [Erysipelothrix rhusiopathiae]